MKKLDFGMDISIEKETGRILAAYLRVRSGKAAKVLELANGNAFANYAVSGELLGIELLGPCELTVLDRLARKEPKPVKEFLKAKLPRELAIAD